MVIVTFCFAFILISSGGTRTDALPPGTTIVSSNFITLLPGGTSDLPAKGVFVLASAESFRFKDASPAEEEEDDVDPPTRCGLLDLSKLTGSVEDFVLAFAAVGVIVIGAFPCCSCCSRLLLSMTATGGGVGTLSNDRSRF